MTGRSTGERRLAVEAGTFTFHPLGSSFNLAQIAAAGQKVWFQSDLVQAQTFPSGWEVGDIVAPADGSIWAAASLHPLRGITASVPASGGADAAKLQRVRPPIAPRGGLQVSTTAKISVDLPVGWQPVSSRVSPASLTSCTWSRAPARHPGLWHG